MIDIPDPIVLQIDKTVLVNNWRWLAQQSAGASCGAAVKANAYGLGAQDAVRHLSEAGCRDFFVATWAEARSLAECTEGLTLSVFHGVSSMDMAAAVQLHAKPVLNSLEQIALWKQGGHGKPCDVMVDTGMNRLGVSWDQVLEGALDDLAIHTLCSHLASADEDVPQTQTQLERFRLCKNRVSAHRYSLANSAGICLGADYAFDLTRPGLALYGGIPRAEAVGHIKQVAFPKARVLQVRTVKSGEAVGYNATWQAQGDRTVAIAQLGYADGYLRCHSDLGSALWNGHIVPSIGRVSMDLTAFDVTDAPPIHEEDWLAIEYDLPKTAALTGRSQYELLTSFGARYKRSWF